MIGAILSATGSNGGHHGHHGGHGGHHGGQGGHHEEYIIVKSKLCHVLFHNALITIKDVSN